MKCRIYIQIRGFVLFSVLGVILYVCLCSCMLLYYIYIYICFVVVWLCFFVLFLCVCCYACVVAGRWVAGLYIISMFNFE